MITVCTVFYPWTQAVERQKELFEALVPSIQRCKDSGRIELSIIDTGTRDIYNRKRKHNAKDLERRLKEELPNVVYSLEDCFDDNGTWHLSKALHLAARQASHDRFFFVGIDIILPKGFCFLMDMFVSNGQVWVPLCYNLLPGQKWEIPKQPKKFNGWRIAQGILGITREDFYRVGGYPIGKVGFRVGIDKALLVKCRNNYKLNSHRQEGLFHLHHEHSKAGLKGKVV